MEDKIIEYECINEMMLPKCDDDEFPIENEYGFVTAGSKWYIDTVYHSIIGGEVHLESSEESEFGWIEITQEDLEKNFKQLN